MKGRSAGNIKITCLQDIASVIVADSRNRPPVLGNRNRACGVEVFYLFGFAQGVGASRFPGRVAVVVVQRLVVKSQGSLFNLPALGVVPHQPPEGVEGTSYRLSATRSVPPDRFVPVLVILNFHGMVRIPFLGLGKAVASYVIARANLGILVVCR